MTTALAGSNVVVLRGIVDLLEDELPAMLAAAASALGLTLPAPAAVYVGSFADQPGVWPAIGVYLEGSTYETKASPCYNVEHAVTLSITLADGYVAAATPSEMQLACQAYVETACRCVASKAPAELGAAGVYDAEIVRAVADDSPYVVENQSGQQWTVRAVRGDVRVLQTVQREVS